MKMSRKHIVKLVALAMLLALVVVIQMNAGLIKIGPFSPSLVLIPIVVASILLGYKYGALLGGAFGLVVLFQCIMGLDAGGNILWGVNPFYTALICLVKGICAGLVPGLVYKAMTKGKGVSSTRRMTATIIASLTAPVVNTGLFLLGLSVLFTDVLYTWSGGTNVLLYIFTGLIGINFILEFFINAVLSPAISTIAKIGSKKLFN